MIKKDSLAAEVRADAKVSSKASFFAAGFATREVERGALLFWAALLTLGAGLTHIVGTLSQPPASTLLLALLLGFGAIQMIAALAVVVAPSVRRIAAATALEAGALLIWFLTRSVGVPLGSTVWRPETLGAMDYYLPALEGLSAVLFLALIGQALPKSFGRTVITALPTLLGLSILLLAVLNRTETVILLVAGFFTMGIPTSLLDIFVPAVAALLALLVLRRFSPRLDAFAPRLGRTTLRLLPALLVTSLLAWGSVSTALDRAWLPLTTTISAPLGQTTTLMYCSPGGDPLAMDLTEPATRGDGAAPAVFYIHGGEGLVGDRVLQGDEGPYLTRLRDELVARGFVVGSIDYGLSPVHHLDEQVEDAKCAVRFLRAHASELNVDPNRIGVYGDSEGGYMVDMLGTTGPRDGFDVGQYLNQSSRVQAVVDMWGPTDLTNWTGSPSWVSALGAGLRSPGQSSAQARAASPLNDVAAGDPPFLIIQGADDWFIAPHHSQDFAKRLQAAGVPATLVMVQHDGHGLVAPTAGYVEQPSPDALIQMMADFFIRTLGH